MPCALNASALNASAPNASAPNASRTYRICLNLICLNMTTAGWDIVVVDVMYSRHIAAEPGSSAWRSEASEPIRK